MLLRLTRLHTRRPPSSSQRLHMNRKAGNASRGAKGGTGARSSEEGRATACACLSADEERRGADSRLCTPTGKACRDRKREHCPSAARRCFFAAPSRHSLLTSLFCSREMHSLSCHQRCLRTVYHAQRALHLASELRTEVRPFAPPALRVLLRG